MLPSALLAGLAAPLALMFCAWLVSIPLRDVSIVDVFWGPNLLAAGIAYGWVVADPGLRAPLVLGLVALWAVRLSAHLAARNFGEPEDRRYRAMREKRGRGFWWQSLFVVFTLQAVIAWVVSWPLLGAVSGAAPLGWLDAAGVALFAFGLGFEALADWQLARFLDSDDGAGGVMDRGLWAWSRHPNYFGEFCLWWGIWLLALAAGAAWTVIGVLLLTVLLLKVSGVALTERTIAGRRPGYAEYVRRTSAFWPRPPRTG